MNFFKKLFGSSTKSDVPAPTPNAAESPEPDAANQAARVATADCLDRHWQSVGTVEKDVLAYLISPSLTGGPYWPSTRQAYRVVRRGNNIVLATDGLSDPFDDAEGLGNGFEMELFLETADIPDNARGTLGDVDPLRHSWAFELLEHVAKTVANAGGITHPLENHGVLSLELPGFSQSHLMSDQLPDLFVTAPDFPTRLDDMPLSPVQLVPVVLITAAELEYVRTGGRAAREDLVARLQAAGVGHVSCVYRESVV
ncbi:hypothetical protein PS683_03210 [Pseudomonas fluorescens]|uniref:Suppressor of fused-like domain-containing protein n=1 Tax=Pseudomonas fluorescens TaxID=294 RepID=A0A5E6U137_PSEFL|nr:hypothetical protein PS683_03210 [Pseudomonas fluorescens]VVM98542.1 hypothetical protein PS683_03210 [Pseudomonas fluorescens]